MIIRHLCACPEFAAADNTTLRELLHSRTGGFSFRYSLAHARLPAGTASAPHRLSTSEVYCILEGSGIMHIDLEAERVQYIHNDQDIERVFLCIVDPAWRREDEQLL